MPESNTHEELRPWPSDSRLEENRTVIRLKKKTGHHFNIGSAAPTDLFILQPKDIDEGKARGLQPLVSTWDAAVPSATLKKYRRVEPQDSIELWSIETLKIHAITIPTNIPIPTERVALEVHKDKIEGDDLIADEHRTLHFGIQGLFNKPGQANSKTYYNFLQSALRDLCKPSGIVGADQTE
jgi:hypothetical protein